MIGVTKICGATQILNSEVGPRWLPTTFEPRLKISVLGL